MRFTLGLFIQLIVSRVDHVHALLIKSTVGNGRHYSLEGANLVQDEFNMFCKL